jgi:hypothetical protein
MPSRLIDIRAYEGRDDLSPLLEFASFAERLPPERLLAFGRHRLGVEQTSTGRVACVCGCQKITSKPSPCFQPPISCG